MHCNDHAEFVQEGAAAQKALRELEDARMRGIEAKLENLKEALEAKNTEVKKTLKELEPA